MGSRLPLEATRVAQHAVDIGWKGWQVATATAVAWAESALDAYAVGVVGSETRVDDQGATVPNPAYRSLDVGLWQINTFWWPVTIKDMLDPALNAAHAFKMWNAKFTGASGSWADKVHAAWSQWAVYKSGSYEVYLPAAADAARAIGAMK